MIDTAKAEKLAEELGKYNIMTVAHAVLILWNKTGGRRSRGFYYYQQHPSSEPSHEHDCTMSNYAPEGMSEFLEKKS